MIWDHDVAGSSPVIPIALDKSSASIASIIESSIGYGKSPMEVRSVTQVGEEGRLLIS